MQSECALHKGRLTGGLHYAPNTMGNYSMYAPPCNGCDFGKEERFMYGRLAHLSTSVYNAQQDPSDELIAIAWAAMKACLVGKREETQQLIFFAHSLQKLNSSYQEVVDLILNEEFAKAAEMIQS